LSFTDIEKLGELTDRIKALLVTDGSVTALLETFTGAPVRVVGLRQGMEDAGIREAYQLRILQGEKVNRREVLLVDARGQNLEYAVSHTPLSRLTPESRDDVLHTDLPIGKILASHDLESRREVINVGLTRAEEIVELLELPQGSTVPWREYIIIHNGQPLMKIIEFFGRV